MEPNKQLEHLAEKVSEWKKIKTRQANSHQIRAVAVRLASAILGALITIFLGLKINSPDDHLLTNLALVCGALIAVLNVVDNLFRDRALWVSRQVTLLKLYSLEDQIEYYKKGLGESGNASEDDVNKLFNKYCKIWQSSLEEWERLFQEENGVKENERTSHRN